MTITDLTPVEIDTELARIWGEIDKLDLRILNYRRLLAERCTFGARRGELKYTGDERADMEQTIAQTQSDRQHLTLQVHPFENEFVRRGGWNRYFLVKNGNGHVHRGVDCSTCFPTTQYAWLVDLADCDEAAMVEEWGERACTVCFPDAPVNPNYHRPARVDREAREAREAEKAARQAAKDAKAITDVDGSTLKDGHGYAIKTKVAARNELTRCIESIGWYGLDHPQHFQDTVRRLVPALEAAGVDWRKAAANKVKAITRDGSRHLAEVKALLKEVGA